MSSNSLVRILPVLFLLLSIGSATAAGPSLRMERVELTPPASRIVGTWEAAVRLGPCGGPLGPPFLAFIVFHAGGTLTDISMAPLAGVPTPFGQSVRSVAFGTWAYDRRSRTYTAQQRFNWFVEGFYDGYQQIHFDDIELLSDGSSLSGTLRATRNFIDGRPPVSFCGELSMVRTP
jgi:hypothetical protein